ncbi:sulfotransferase family protein [Mycobacterium sp. BMJ-28]
MAAPLSSFGAAPRLDGRWLRVAACRAAHSEWIDDAYLDEALDVLAHSLCTEARLSFMGRKMAQVRLVRMLSTRLQLRQLLERRPEITSRPVEPPIVIVGLQRTGTTLLHRLLAADPGSGSMLSWEGAHPLPDPRQIPGRPDLRIMQAGKEERALRYLQPQFFAIHSLESTAPEEDVLLLDYSLHSQMPEVMFHVPTYARWLSEQNMADAYELHRLLLQVLDWQQPRGRWVLKSPAHLEHLDVLLRTFPGAVVVWTHRDPAQTTASSSSMLAHYQALFSDRVDHHEVARYWLDKNANMIERAIDFRETSDATFVDVHYQDLLADPMHIVDRIYEAEGRQLTDIARRAMQDELSAHRQHQHGEHRYSLEQFGLTATEVDDAYARYVEHFSVPAEPGGVRDL